MSDNAPLVGHENNRQGNAVPRLVGETFIDDIKGLDDRRVFVSQQGKPDIASFGEFSECRDLVETDRSDGVAEGLEFADPFVPGDRLNLTAGSPIE
jgi:hypothetical protein